MRAVWIVHDRRRAERIRAVARLWPRWPAASEDAPLRGDQLTRVAFWLGFAAFQAIAALAPGPPGGTPTPLWGPLAAGLAPVFLLSGWLLHLSIRRQGWSLRSVPPALRLLCGALLCLPLLGFLLAPAWRWLAGRRDGKLVTGHVQAAALDLQRGTLSLRARAERQLSRLLSLRHLYLWILAAQMPAVLAGAAWLSQAGAPGRPLAACRIGTVWILHSVALASLYHAALGRIERFKLEGWRALLLRVAPVVTVAPLPFWPSLFVPLLWVGAPGGAGRKDGLLVAVWGSLSRTAVFLPELRLEKRLRSRSWLQRLWSWMKVRLPVDDSAEDRRLAALYRWQAFLILLDATALGSLGVANPVLRHSLAISAWMLLIGLAFVLQAGVLIGRLTGILGKDIYAQPYCRYLGLTQGALLFGLIYGALLAASDARQLGSWLILTAKLCLLCALYFLPVAYAGGRGDRLAGWCLAFVTMAGLGYLLGHGHSAVWLLPVLRVAVFAFPLWHLALGLTLGLPAPPPTTLPARPLAAALVTLSGWLPLGGLAIPLWIYLQHRRRREAR